MKSKKLLLLSLALVGIIFASCKKDEGDNTQKFSPLSIEENKANIENNGFELLNIIKEVETCPSVNASKNMLNYLSQGDMFGANPNIIITKVSKSNAFFMPVIATSSMNRFNAKAVAKEMMGFNPDTIEDLFNTFKGIYEWNSETGDWDYTNSNSELRIEFPSTSSGTTNNVVYRIYDCTFGSWGVSELNMPTQIKVEMKVNNDVLITYLFKITVDSELGIPTSLVSTLTLSPYTFSLEASLKDLSVGSVTYKWTKNSTILMKIAINATSDILTNPEEEIGSVVKDGNFLFQLMNIKLTGNANIKAIYDQMEQINYDNLSDSLAVVKKCEIFNKNAKVLLCYVDNNTIIAKVVAYSEPIYEWDEYYQEYVKTYDIGLRFVFADNSGVDFKTYFSEGFNSLAEEFIYYINDLKSKYAK